MIKNVFYHFSMYLKILKTVNQKYKSNIVQFNILGYPELCHTNLFLYDDFLFLVEAEKKWGTVLWFVVVVFA